jgi:predicted KAP-like P-loop ATPase
MFWRRKRLPDQSSPAPGDRTPETEGAAAASAATYSTDRPIRSAGEDRFARAPFAARIGDTIAHRPDVSSLVLGLYGPWGDGKSSVLSMIEERLAGEPNVIVVNFNPWHFSSEEQLIRGFFATLAAAIGHKLPTLGEQIGKAMVKYGGLLSVASASVGGVVSINPGKAAKDFGEAISTATLQDLKERIEDGLANAGKRVVVLIDDIDRLDRTETHAIFKLVKLSAGFNYTTYLLAFDAEVVAAALGERYGEGGYTAGRAFLEKIIQVPLRLPPADPDALRRLVFEGVDQALTHANIELDRRAADAFVVQVAGGLELQLTTPRQARLYANALLFSLPLVDGEVNIVDFLLVEGLRIFYPNLYDAIRDEPALWVAQEYRGGDRSERIAGVLADTAPMLTEAERSTLVRGMLLYLFPRISRTVYGSDFETVWAAEKRICSHQYFKRYFAFGVPPQDISDRAIRELTEAGAELGAASLQARLESLLRTSAKATIKKLRLREAETGVVQAEALIRALTPLGDLLPVERGPFEVGGTRAQGAILLAQWLRRVPGAQRVALAETVIREAAPLPFAAECVSWFQPGRDEQLADQLLMPETLAALQRILAARIAVADIERPLYRSFGAAAKALYWIWEKVASGAVRERLTAQLEGQPDEVEAFVGIYIGEAWGMTDGLPRPADLRREVYDDIATRVDPDILFAALRGRYGAELDEPVFHQDEGAPVGRRLAHQFAVIHAAARADSTPHDPDAPA